MENTIGNNIRKYRELAGFSQKELAEKLGVTNTRLSNWEQGTNNPPADFLGKICVTLDISASELLGLNISIEELSQEERRVLELYREKQYMQHAIKVLLGIEKS